MRTPRTLVSILCAVAMTLPLSALSYDNNEFQQKSRAYSSLAEKAYDEGQYEAAVDYARKAEENAALSAEFIERMIARADSQNLLFAAHTRLAWATGKNAGKYFPAPFNEASDAVASADEFFDAEDYASSSERSQFALERLSAVREVIPLPAQWKVQKWITTRDCLWNIAANPAVYGDPFMWEELYKANKKTLKQPANPDLLAPGMVITIPSVKGEYREGIYDPSMKYESFKSQTKK
jgi:nucleoid-associated protein YgaU